MLAELVHLDRVVARRSEREARQLADGHPDDREQSHDDDLDDGEVDRREQPPQAHPGPRRQGRAEPSGRPAARPAGRSIVRLATEWSAAPPSGGSGARRQGGGWGGARLRSGLGGRAASAATSLAACRARSKSARRSCTSSSPTLTRSSPGVIPLASSSASESWRCEVDGGCTTIVWTLPSDAVSSVSRSVSDTARPPSRPPTTSKASIPPPLPSPELLLRDGTLRMAGETRIEDASHGRVTLEPRRESQGVGGVAVDPHGECEEAPEDEERLEWSERAARVDLRASHLLDQRPRPGGDTGHEVAVTAEVLGGRLHDDVGAELERPADVRRGERVVDDVDRAGPVGHGCERSVVREKRRGVRRGLREQHPRGRRGERSLDGVVVGHVDELDVHAEPAERAHELGSRRAVQRVRGDDPIARSEERREGGVDSGHARREGVARLAPGELGVGVAERLGGGVGEAAVGKARPRVADDVAELLRILRGERRRLVDRDRGRALGEARAA